MIENREFWVAETIRLEGGEKYTNRPEDRGGPTKFGITHTALAKSRGVKSVGPEEVAQLEQDEAEQIYRTDFWNAVRGDQLPSGIDIYVADFAVLSGPRRAATFLQQLVGAKPDGFVGEKTIAAVRAMRPLDVLLKLHHRRLEFMVRIPGEANDAGWVNRVSEVLAIAESRIVSRPMLAEAIGSRIVTANVPAAAASLGGLGWLVDQYGPLVLEWLKERADDPATLDMLQSGVAQAGTLPVVVTVMAAALAVSLGVNGFTVWQRIGMWRQGKS